MGTRSVRIGRGTMRSPGRPSVLHRSERRPFWQAIADGSSSEEAAQVAGVSQAVGTRWFRECGGMPHRIFRLHRHHRQDGTCRWLSVSRWLCCVHRVREFERLPGNLHVPRRRSRASCDAMPRPEAEASRIERSRRSGTPIVRHDVPSLPSWRSTPGYEAMCKIGWPARLLLLEGRQLLAPQ